MRAMRFLQRPVTRLIINLEHADAAYEWQFLGVNEFRRMQMNLTEGGRPEFSAVDGDMTPEQVTERFGKRRFSRSTSIVSG